MQREIFTLTTILLAAIAMSAAPISRQQALNRAQASLAKQGININVADMQEAMPLKAQSTHAAATQAYYVFSSSSSFVIAAGDDRMPEVLGYSDNGNIDPNDMPDGLKELLDGYEMVTSRLTDGNPAQRTAKVSRPAIAPLLKTKWNQNAPFNLKAPVINGQQCPSGCVATAMAQVMNYWKWPNEIDSIPSYTNNGITTPVLYNDGFPSWDNIKDDYQYNETGVEADAVASLLLYCGYAVKMGYSPSASGAQTANVPRMLYLRFKYAPSARYITSDCYTREQWEDILYNELAEHRPVVYCGYAYESSGHAFVCDGIDADGRIHINWGWGGHSDGYFLLTNLNPYDQGVGGSETHDGFIYNYNGMAVGVAPLGMLDHDIIKATMRASDVYPIQKRITRTSANEAFDSVAIHANFKNAIVGKTIKGRYGLALYDTKGNYINDLASTDLAKLPAGESITQDYNCTIGPDIQDGTYYIYPVCANQDETTWTLCEAAMVNCLKATIGNNVLTLDQIGINGITNYQVNSVEFIGSKHSGCKIEVKANVTNLGDTYLRNVFLLVDDKAQTVAQCYLSPGQSGTLTMHFTAPAEGNHTVKLALGEKGSKTLWTGDLTIYPPSKTFVDIKNIVVNNATTDSTITGNHMDFTITVKCLDSEYDDIIFARIYNQSFSLIKTLNFLVDLKRNCDTTINGSFENLEPGETYQIYFGQYYYGNPYLPWSTKWYTVVDTPQDPYDINGNGIVDIVDINIIIHIMMLEDHYSPYFKQADINGDGIVDIVDVNTLVMHALSLD